MNRRGFLRSLIAAPVVAPIALSNVVSAPRTTKVIQWPEPLAVGERRPEFFTVSRKLIRNIDARRFDFMAVQRLKLELDTQEQKKRPAPSAPRSVRQ